MDIGDIKYIAYLDDIKELEGKLDKEFDSIIKKVEDIIENTPDVFHDAPQSSITEDMTPSDFDYGLTLCGHGDVGNFPSINDYGVSLTLRGKNISYAQIFITRHGDIWSRRSSIIDEWNGEWYSVANEIDKKADIKDLQKLADKLDDKANIDIVGDLDNLSTSNKTNLVDAINEIKDGYIVEQREPTIDDMSYEVGQRWYNRDNGAMYILNHISDDGAVWDAFYKNKQLVATKTYGVVIDNNNANPETRVKYIDDAVGFKPVRGNNGSVDWGSWKDTFIYEKFKPCVVKNGVVQYYLDKDNFNKKIDGSDAILTGKDGDVMIEIGKIWYKLDNYGDKQYVRISNVPQGDFKCLAHTRGDDEVNNIYIGAYLGYEQDGKLRSISGVTPTGDKKIEEFRELAEANGVRYHQVPFATLVLLQSIMLIMLKSTDTQSALGVGHTQYGSYSKTGNTNSKGMVYGSKSNAEQVSFMGIEDFWGNKSWWIDGLYFDNGVIRFTTTNFNNLASNYIELGRYEEVDSGYIKYVTGTTETGFIPTNTNGSSSTYFCDNGGVWHRTYPYFGGSDSSDVGGFFFKTYNSTRHYPSLGSRLFMYERYRI